MQLIRCPWCGPREETEFCFGGQAHVAYPSDPAALSDEQWARFVFVRANPLGLAAERWRHAAACGRWFNAVRDTRTYEFHATYPIGSSAPTEPVTSAAPLVETLVASTAREVTR